MLDGREGGRTDGNALDFGVGVLDGDIIEGEHAVEGFSNCLDLVCC